MGKNRDKVRNLSQLEKDVLGPATVAQMEAAAAEEDAAEATPVPETETVEAATETPVVEEQPAVEEAVVEEKKVEAVVEPVAEAVLPPVAPPVPADAPKAELPGLEDSSKKLAGTAPAPQVQAAPKAAPAPVTAPAQTVASGAEFGAIGRRVLDILRTYIVEMAPRRPVTDAKIVEQQRLLFEAMTKTINDSGDDFEKLLKTVFAIFEEHKNGVFHETRVFRGTENLPMSLEDRNAFLRLLNLFKLVANPQSRKLNLKQVDLHASLQYGVTELGRNRLMSFFGQ